jgi:hypothetical protein
MPKPASIPVWELPEMGSHHFGMPYNNLFILKGFWFADFGFRNYLILKHLAVRF